ncbi:hypothetical protein ANCDUO_05510 [Ancylostoma duodenale]|uniref:Uncharacterized protein n=1 Tax=Ancylostoma duodenale TaxID=51022 RepID=A0A0C2D3W8_9BILA|nr:hypothetical protein ANCDUO_05510 [Ancylostoma duodenale]
MRESCFPRTVTDHERISSGWRAFVMVVCMRLCVYDVVDWTKFGHPTTRLSAHLEQQMKKLKRRLSAAFRGGGSQQNVELCGANGLTNVYVFHAVNIRYYGLVVVGKGLAVEGVIVEECDPTAAVLRHPYHRYHRAPQSRAASMYNPRVYSGYYGSHACSK